MSQEWLDALAPLGTDWHKPHLEDAPYLIVVFVQTYGLRTDPNTGQPIKIKHYYATDPLASLLECCCAAYTRQDWQR